MLLKAPSIKHLQRFFLLSDSATHLIQKLIMRKKRAGFYTRNGVENVRRFDLEKANCHVVIIDVNVGNNLRIVNIYKSFRPRALLSANELFGIQLEVIRNAMCRAIHK